MLDLPDVTLIAVGVMSHELLRVAIDDCMAKVKFGEVIIYSDRPELLDIAGTRHIVAPCGPVKDEVMAFYYGEAAQAITTSHALLIEWDAGIRDVGMWRDEFLQYDYIGAPWTADAIATWGIGEPELNVGNGGFLLLSKRLADLIYANRVELPVASDIHPSRDHRRKYEQLDPSIKWASADVAADFAFEYGDSSRPSFGYHDIFNWPLAYDREEVVRRVRTVLQENYVVEQTEKLRILTEQWPWVTEALGPELEKATAQRETAFWRRWREEQPHD